MEKVSKPFTIRKLSRSGNSRSMSIGKLLPPDWVAVKVTVTFKGQHICVLELEEIK